MNGIFLWFIYLHAIPSMHAQTVPTYRSSYFIYLVLTFLSSRPKKHTGLCLRSLPLLNCRTTGICHCRLACPQGAHGQLLAALIGSARSDGGLGVCQRDWSLIARRGRAQKTKAANPGLKVRWREGRRRPLFSFYVRLPNLFCYHVFHKGWQG